jgi:hypothetical protein
LAVTFVIGALNARSGASPYWISAPFLLRAIALLDLFSPALLRGFPVLRGYGRRIDQFFSKARRGPNERKQGHLHKTSKSPPLVA